MKSSQIKLAGFCILFVAIATSGCGKKGHDFVATWIPDKPLFPGIDQSLQLSADSTWKQTLRSDKETLSASGTYKIDKDALMLTELETASGKTVRKSSKNWMYSYKYIWINDDELQLTPNDARLTFGTIKYKRKK